jgi:hypothetical protein
MFFDDEAQELKPKDRKVASLCASDNFIVWHEFVVPRKRPKMGAKTGMPKKKR